MGMAVAVRREPMFRSEQWGMEEGCLDDDGVRSKAMAADSWILPAFSQ